MSLFDFQNGFGTPSCGGYKAVEGGERRFTVLDDLNCSLQNAGVVVFDLSKP